MGGLSTKLYAIIALISRCCPCPENSPVRCDVPTVYLWWQHEETTPQTDGQQVLRETDRERERGCQFYPVPVDSEIIFHISFFKISLWNVFQFRKKKVKCDEPVLHL